MLSGLVELRSVPQYSCASTTGLLMARAVGHVEGLRIVIICSVFYILKQHSFQTKQILMFNSSNVPTASDSLKLG